MKTPTPATVLSAMALLMATAGTGYAAGVLPHNSVGTAQLKPGAVTFTKLAPGTRAKLKGPRGSAGPRGAAGPSGRSALTPLRTGETIQGTWVTEASGVAEARDAVTFPVPAPTPVDSLHAVFDGVDEQPGDGCTGTPAEPVAAPGFVCIYYRFAVNLVTGSPAGYGIRALGDQTDATGDGSVSGFVVFTKGGGGNHYAYGTWAYTAP